MPDILVVATAPEGTLSRSSLELVAGAHAICGPLGLGVTAVLLGTGPGLVNAPQALHQHGVARVLRVDHPLLTAGESDAYLRAIEQVARTERPEVVLISADTMGRDLAVRLAWRLGAALVTECFELTSDNGAVVARRQVYGGRAVASMAVTRRPAVFSMKPRSLDAPAPSPVAGTVEDLTVELEPGDLPTRVREVLREQSDVGLEDAQVVIGGGRGIGGPEGFAQLGELASALGGAVGASRPPADSGWVPLSWQVGQTGKTIRPALYVAVGISGATQHVAGVSGSRMIVAINRDPEAPIFSVAHLGIVADFREIVPPLIAKVKELRGL
ncbi:MAG: electron transfer flavoprotein subunit alpha/FixB family protein [Armatimonadetes bacterium]|nr:electron transfer flavoprotein subunit alpha/FixB family protein [Armatimonadota bacterium]